MFLFKAFITVMRLPDNLFRAIQGLVQSMSFSQPAPLEAALLKRVIDDAQEVLTKVQEIMSVDRNLAHPLLVAYFGANYDYRQCAQIVDLLARMAIPLNFEIEMVKKPWDIIKWTFPRPRGSFPVRIMFSEQFCKTQSITACARGSEMVFATAWLYIRDRYVLMKHRGMQSGQQTVDQMVKCTTQTFIHEMVHLFLGPEMLMDVQMPSTDPHTGRMEIIGCYGSTYCRELADSAELRHLTTKNADSIAFFICLLWYSDKYRDFDFTGLFVSYRANFNSKR